MKSAVYRGEGDIRIEEVENPEIEEPTDVVVRVTHTCICGSDLWFYRGQDVLQGTLDPSPVLDKTVGLEGVPEGYAAMDNREAIKVMVKVGE